MSVHPKIVPVDCQSIDPALFEEPHRKDLAAAAAAGDLKKLELVLSQHLELLNAPLLKPKYSTALHLASRHGCTDCARALLSRDNIQVNNDD